MTGTAAPALCWCPFPDVASAEAAAATLLDEGLIACANIVPGLRTLYAWNGERGGGSEAGALLKTNESLIKKLVARLAELRPYDEPAILGWPCDFTTPGTAAWLGGLTG